MKADPTGWYLVFRSLYMSGTKIRRWMINAISISNAVSELNVPRTASNASSAAMHI
jgi:hypothetical protein